MTSHFVVWATDSPVETVSAEGRTEQDVATRYAAAHQIREKRCIHVVNTEHVHVFTAIHRIGVEAV